MHQNVYATNITRNTNMFVRNMTRQRIKLLHLTLLKYACLIAVPYTTDRYAEEKDCVTDYCK